MLSKEELMNSLPSSQKKNKKKNRVVIADEKLQTLRNKSFEQTYPDLIDPSPEKTKGEEKQPIPSESELIQAQENPPDSATIKDSSQEDVKPEVQRSTTQDIAEDQGKPVKKSKSNKGQLNSEPPQQSRRSSVATKNRKPLANVADETDTEIPLTSLSCPVETISRVRVICAILGEKQYHFVSKALQAYDQHLRQKGLLTFGSHRSDQQTKEEKNMPKAYLNCSVEANQQVKINTALLRLKKYQYSHQAITFYVQHLLATGTIDKESARMLQI